MSLEHTEKKRFRPSFTDFVPLIGLVVSALGLYHASRLGLLGLFKPNKQPLEPLTPENLYERLSNEEAEVAAGLLRAANEMGFEVYGNQVEVVIDPPVEVKGRQVNTTLPDLGFVDSDLPDPLKYPQEWHFLEVTTFPRETICRQPGKQQQLEIMNVSGLSYGQYNVGELLQEIETYGAEAVITSWLQPPEEK